MSDKPRVIPLNAESITPEVIANMFVEEASKWRTVVIIGIDGDGDVCLHSCADQLEVAYLSQALMLFAQSLTVNPLLPKGVCSDECEHDHEGED